VPVLPLEADGTSIGSLQVAGQSQRLCVRYVLAIWGDRYIDRFFDLAFPTHLAPGNLPAVAQGADLSFVILTRQQDEARFRSHSWFGRMQALGPVEFISIDDLISHAGVFTVTLTLAFTRAMRAAGPQAVDTCFLFMNADFMLADGTLATVVRKMSNGASAVLAASPRAISEELAVKIAGWPRQPDASLAIPPRELVGLALSAPHAMVITKQPNLKLLHSRQPNQFFWFVDDQTLLARSFILFMLAVRPNRADYQATSYCDYSMVADLVDQNRISVIDDSDDGFLLEMQARRQEIETIRFGALSAEFAAEHLAEWTTEHHRWAAGRDLVFHSGPLPAGLARVRTDAAALISSLIERLPPPPEVHAHQYWLSGVAAWQLHRGDGVVPPELWVSGAPAVLKQDEVSPVLIAPTATQGQFVLRVYRGLHVLAAPLRRVLAKRPRVCNFEDLVDHVSHGNNGLIISTYGSLPASIARLLRLRGVGQSEHSSLAQVGNSVRTGGLAIISLSDDDFDQLPDALGVAHKVVLAGGTAHLIVQHDYRDGVEFELDLAERLAVARPEILRFASARSVDDGELVRLERQLLFVLRGFRATPSAKRLGLAIGATLRVLGRHTRVKARVWRDSGLGRQVTGAVITFKKPG
jgi:hypothetical protein